MTLTIFTPNKYYKVKHTYSFKDRLITTFCNNRSICFKYYSLKDFFYITK